MSVDASQHRVLTKEILLLGEDWMEKGIWRLPECVPICNTVSNLQDCWLLTEANETSEGSAPSIPRVQISTILWSHTFCWTSPWVSTISTPLFLHTVLSSQLSVGMKIYTCRVFTSQKHLKRKKLSNCPQSRISMACCSKAQDHMWSENREAMSAYTAHIYQSC